APDLSTNRYHPNWRNLANLRFGNPPAQQQLQPPLPQPAQNMPPPAVATSRPSLEDIVKQMAAQNIQFQQQMVAQNI
ncbi:hypothetical protein A2U01_0098406, partial [Trifolium medium]|nr:hypothetical protein [Trifolium medium]